MFKFNKREYILISVIILFIVIIYILLCIYNFKLIDNPYINKLFYIIVSLVTAFILYFQKESNRKIAQNLSFQYMKRWTEDPVQSYKKIINFDVYNELKRLCTKEEIKRYFSDDEVLKNKKNFKLRSNIYDFCNFFEEMAIAIKYNIVEEEILKEFFKGVIKEYFDILKDFIDTQRELDNDKEIFIEFEKLNDKWR